MIRLAVLATLAFLAAACANIRTPPETASGPDFLLRNAAAKRVQATQSGLHYFVVRAGPKAGRHPADGDRVTFHYEGKLLTGETFDSSYARGEPISGAVGVFVPGFNEALKLMKPGDEWIIWIPPELGYSDEASESIPANSILRFRLELHSINAAS